ncbi:hypothetical protein D5S17_36005 [Pseudonocardiaceae bacterium YIM PH 21723]|nr:hypothetical protein D5S17_36005 [Pseudonocardiaceae bacterium YIM PH 21723]
MTRTDNTMSGHAGAVLQAGYIGNLQVHLANPARAALRVPRQLLPLPVVMLDREPELHELKSLCAPGGFARVVVSGRPGVGKRSLLAKLQREHVFTDGVLTVDLGGTAVPEELLVASVLCDLMRSLGVPDDRYPARAAAVISLWHEVTAPLDLGVLVLNVPLALAGVLERLLPASESGALLVTSPSVLDMPGFTGLELDGLPHEAARDLLHHAAGRPAIALDSAYDAVVKAVGGHPLCVWLAGDVLRRGKDPASIEALVPRSLRTAEETMNSIITTTIIDLGNGHDRTVLDTAAFLHGQIQHPATVAELTGYSVEQAEDGFTVLCDRNLADMRGGGYVIRAEATGVLEHMVPVGEQDRIRAAHCDYLTSCGGYLNGLYKPHRWIIGEKVRAGREHMPAGFGRFCTCEGEHDPETGCHKKRPGLDWMAGQTPNMIRAYMWLFRQQRYLEAGELLEAWALHYIHAGDSGTAEWMPLVLGLVPKLADLPDRMPWFRQVVQLSFIYFCAGDAANALLWTQTACEAAPTLPDPQALPTAYQHMTVALLMNGEQEAAVAAGHRALAAERERPDRESATRSLVLTCRRLARACYETQHVPGRGAEAVELLSEAKAKAVDPDDKARVTMELADALASQGQIAQALKVALPALVHAEESGNSADWTAQGNRRIARILYRRAAQLHTDPNSRDALSTARILRAIADEG